MSALGGKADVSSLVVRKVLQGALVVGRRPTEQQRYGRKKKRWVPRPDQPYSQPAATDLFSSEAKQRPDFTTVSKPWWRILVAGPAGTIIRILVLLLATAMIMAGLRTINLFKHNSAEVVAAS
jgi:hypothetical protein